MHKNCVLPRQLFAMKTIFFYIIKQSGIKIMLNYVINLLQIMF
ncbi:MAG: hypothetical protein JWR38_1003 [Mucilaginibacter sp.]|nr:hypothetical protein [Mucilaginibacter sp.]